MGELRDYEQWHQAYDDPDSAMSWRLSVVRRYLTEALAARSGPVRLLSLCAGDGRDVVGVLGSRADARRVAATLVELHPVIAENARRDAAAAGLDRVEVRTAVAGTAEAYADAVPADIVLLVGIFGNITDDDLIRTVRAAPQLCTPGARLVWSRGRHLTDPNDRIRGWFSDAGFAELDYATREGDGQPALGCVRYDGQPTRLEPTARLFTFVR